ncbi:MAG: T9SS type A sorting domain-containing protein [Bacteroidetes bacterium]|nr:T9SS type A sorting domain-containing protein [Bacteroidota bacterium]
MRNQYFAILLLLLGSLPLQGQIGFQPIPSYDELKRANQQELQQQAEELEFFTGIPAGKLNLEPPATELRAPCPNFDETTYYLLPGEEVNIFVDTFGLGGGPNASLTLITCDPVDAGTAALDTTSLSYTANMGIDSGVDTLCIEFCPEEGDCFTLTYPVVVRRAGTSYTLAEVPLAAGEFLPEYCLDETLLPGDLACSRLIDCGDTYDGDGRQTVYFTSYIPNSSCIRYKASQFAGIDEVCVVLCDEFTVCDTFHIPFRIVSDTLSLPFFDDFSYTGPYPSFDYWLDRDVYVNNTMAANPPSVGMATFDGVDRTGSTYNTEFGFGDQLTSKYIDLSNPSGDVVLKFFLAPKGYGLYPNETDTLFLEFRDASGNWESIVGFPGLEENIPLDSVPAFQFQAVQINEAQYLYDGFQFRFRNLVSPAGLFDLWHVDYVYLNDGEDDTSNFEDLAFTASPSSILANYSSMPWRHFENFVDKEFTGTDFESGFYNHFENTVSVTESAILLEEDLTGFAFAGAENVVDGVDANIPPKEPVSRNKTINALITDGYKDDLESQFPDAEKVRLKLQYELTQNSQDPLFFRNDTVVSYTNFDNYFAYDDGSAEGYLFLENPQGVNPSFAQKFHTNVEDTLRAIQFHFPHVNGNVSNQLFNFRVYVGGDEPGDEPDFEAIFQTPVYPDIKFDTLQGFTTYRLQNILGELTPLYLPADTDFYVEFQQATVINEGIPIGFDFNNEKQANTLYNLGDGWLSLDSTNFEGALMMRAVVGDFTPPNTAVEEVESETQKIVLYPNPGDGILNLEGLERPEDWEYRLFDATGRVLRRGTAQSQLNFYDMLNGWYILQIFHPENGQMISKKLIIQK